VLTQYLQKWAGLYTVLSWRLSLCMSRDYEKTSFSFLVLERYE
jgi:hypothetical protein